VALDPAARGDNRLTGPAPLADLLGEYWRRYRLPLIVGETNIRGFASDRATWLKYTLEQCERARAANLPVDGYCWFPFIDSCDWEFQPLPATTPATPPAMAAHTAAPPVARGPGNAVARHYARPRRLAKEPKHQVPRFRRRHSEGTARRSILLNSAAHRG